MSKRAIITGITGQDGSYLAELLVSKGYDVVGTVRRASAPNYWRIQHLLDRLTLRPADLLDQLSLIRLVDEVRCRIGDLVACIRGGASDIEGGLRRDKGEGCERPRARGFAAEVHCGLDGETMVVRSVVIPSMEHSTTSPGLR